MLSEILLWSFVGSIGSLAGGLILAMRKKQFSHHQTLLLTSFAAGVILAAALFDLLPEAMELYGTLLPGWILAGMVFLFLLEKSFIWYHHHHEGHGDFRATPWLLTIGDSVHNFIDGMTMAGAFLVNPGAGVVAAAAVAAHEVPHEMADFGVLLSHGWSRWKTIGVNVASACLSLVGSLVVYFNRDLLEPWLPHLLSFSAGSFIYLACSDLIPELHHDHKHSVGSIMSQVVIFGLGIAVVWSLIMFLEAGH